jgi:hypothetical protein
MRKHWERLPGNKKETKTHRRRLLKAARKRGMAAAGYYSPCQLREGIKRGRRDSNLIENDCGEKTLGMVVGEIKKRQKLTVAVFSKRLASGG